MKIEQLPSGKYRIRKMVNGRSTSYTFDHKPTEAEINVMLGVEVNKKSTFRQAAIDYVESKRNILSPSTIKEYTETIRRLSPAFLDTPLSKMTGVIVQKEVNLLAKTRKPKTVRNYHGCIFSVLKMYKPDLILRTTLPKNRQDKKYIPTKEDVQAILDYSVNSCGGRYYIPLVLASYGLRRSEILAITGDSVQGNVLTIDSGIVLNDEKEWVKKDMPKTVSSIRKIPIPWEVALEIKEQGYAYKGHPNCITEFLYDACDRLEIPRFSIHKLRHFFASQLSANNVDIETILSLGGWQTDHVMKTTYRHKVTEKELEASALLEDMLMED